MALPVRCDRGHSYIQADVYPPDWPEDAPRCPECLKIWMAENDVDKMPNFPSDERLTWNTARFEILEDFMEDYEVICIGHPDAPICTCYDTNLGTAKEMAERIAILLNQMVVRDYLDAATRRVDLTNPTKRDIIISNPRPTPGQHR